MRILTLLLVLLAVGPGWAQDAKPPAALPAPIPVPEIPRQAEEATILLRSLEAETISAPEIEAIKRELPQVSASLTSREHEAKLVLESEPPLARLDSLTDSWKSARLDLRRWVELLTARATRLEYALARLTEMRQTWPRARTDARGSRAPAQVVERTEAVLAAVEVAVRSVGTSRTATLVLLDQAAQQMVRCDETLARIARVREGAASQLLVRDTPAIWSPESRARLGSNLEEAIRESARVNLAQLQEVVARRRGTLLLQGALLLVLVVLVRAARQRARRWREAGEVAAETSLVFPHPVAGAFLIALLGSFWLYPRESRALRDLVEILALVPVACIMRPLIPAPLRPWFYALGAVFVADRVRDMAALSPLMDQGPLLLELLIGILVLAGLLGRARHEAPHAEAAGAGAVVRRVRIGAFAMLLFFAAAFVMGSLGNVSLARLVGPAILRSGYLALVLMAVARVLHGLGALALHVEPLRALRIVQAHRAALARRMERLVGWVTVGVWSIVTLEYFGLLTPTASLLRTALTAELRQGAISVSLRDVLAFAITVWLSFVVSRVIRLVLVEEIYPRVNLAPGLPYAVSTLLRYAILFVGFLLGIAALGVDLNKVTVLGGAFGVGIGFGLQNVVNNFVSGLIVLFERPVRVGDSVQVADVLGEVRRIGIRSSTVRTYEGAEVIIPNATLVSERVTNWTPADRARRISLSVGVAYGSDPRRVIELLHGVAQATPLVASVPAPLALFTGFGDSSMNFELRAWSDLESWVQVRSDLGVSVYTALRAAGIEIPFPQREVRLRRDPPAGSA